VGAWYTPRPKHATSFKNAIDPGPMRAPPAPSILVVGAGAIGGVVAGSPLGAGHDVAVLTTNSAIHDALVARGFRLTGKTALSHAKAGSVLASVDGARKFDVVLLATQPPQVEAAARDALPVLSPKGVVV